MKFSEIYGDNQFHFSLEIFPPKTQDGVTRLIEELNQLKQIHPAYVSVTYGAMGTTRDLTKDLSLQIHQELNLNIAFHFTCIGSSKEEMRNYVTGLREKGIHLIVALRGDKPKDIQNYQPPLEGFRYANELISFLHEINGFSIAAAGYPEKHIEAPNIKTDLENLKRKVDAGASVIITQLFFNNQLFYDWVNQVRKIGIQIPIIAGIMPILNLKQIQRITKICGASLPIKLFNNLERSSHDEKAMRQVGIDHATEQCRDLIQNRVSGIHFYCLNKSYSVLKIVDSCSDLV